MSSPSHVNPADGDLGSGASIETTPAEYRRVAMATAVGTTIEWYDFFIYATVAGLLFGPLFFAGLGDDLSVLISFATVGVAFFFRPAGAIVMGHVGDRYGRRVVLVFTLGLMGVATTAIGLLPTTAQIGVWAPILLIVLRCAQGFSAGGEWGGAAMMAVEHAPEGQRGKFGAYPQIGVPLGMLLATGFLTVLTAVLSREDFEAWGWRIPFLFSFVLILIGWWIRRTVKESPVFTELKLAKQNATAPQSELLRKHPKAIFTAAAAFMGIQALGYMLVGGFIVGYADRGGLERSEVLLWALVAAAFWVFTTMGSAILSDRIGRTKVYKIGYVLMILGMLPMFWAVSAGVAQGQVWLVALALLWMVIPCGMTYGPQAAMYAEMFPPHIRLSGVSLSYAIGAVFGGAFAPMIAQWITQNSTVVNVAWYLMAVAVISLVAMFFIQDRSKDPLPTMSGV
ncbi:MAG: MFS transporter [Mobilicoccus sp.]|nr:MFS transporter [Mobilicoccus sp.]